MGVTALDHIYSETHSWDDAVAFEVGAAVDVEQPLSSTHWGTRWIRVRDPEGRIFCLEEAQAG